MPRAILRLPGMMRLALAALTLALATGGLAGFTVEAADAQPRKPAAPVVKRPVKRVRKVVRVRRKPAPRPAVALDTCTVAADCTIYFRSQGCFPGDPLAINTRSAARARTMFPPKREECAMGGPQWEKQMRMNERRWSTTCEAHRCVVHDAGLHDPLEELLRPD